MCMLWMSQWLTLRVQLCVHVMEESIADTEGATVCACYGGVNG